MLHSDGDNWHVTRTWLLGFGETYSKSRNWCPGRGLQRASNVRLTVIQGLVLVHSSLAISYITYHVKASSSEDSTCLRQR